MLEVVVREGKGFKDRITPLAVSLASPLEEHLRQVRARWELDCKEGLAGVWLPGALERKLPNAAKEWGWQWVFPARSISTDPRSGVKRRHHLDPAAIDKAIKVAVAKAGYCEAGEQPHIPAQFCHALAATRYGHPNDSGFAWAQGCFHNDDLHPRLASGRNGRAQSVGWMRVEGRIERWKLSVGS